MRMAWCHLCLLGGVLLSVAVCLYNQKDIKLFWPKLYQCKFIRDLLHHEFSAVQYSAVQCSVV